MTSNGAEGCVRRLLVSVTLAVATAAAGSGTGVVAAAPAGAATDVDEWVVGFCDALGGWRTSATKVRDLVQGVVDGGVPSAAKATALRTRIASGFGAASRAAALTSAIFDTGTAFADARAAAAKASTDPKNSARR
jgi:hypothetical protein